MQGMLFLGDKKVGLRDFPDPTPSANQVVVKMKATGLCGSDLRPYRSTLDGLGARASVIGGHEPCGEVVELGPDVRILSVGDRVMVHHYSGCGHCEHCLSGWAQLCQNGMTLYGSQAHGGFADYQLVEAHMCVPMPDSLTFEEGAACSCGTGTAYQAIKRLGVSGRDTFAVFGQGPVGLNATLFGAATGANVIAIDPIAERRELALKLGASHAIDPTTTDPIEAIKEVTDDDVQESTLIADIVLSPPVEPSEMLKLFGWLSGELQATVEKVMPSLTGDTSLRVMFPEPIFFCSKLAEAPTSRAVAIERVLLNGKKVERKPARSVGVRLTPSI